MNEREIFAAALDCPTDVDRRAFLDGLGDPTLCGRIEALLEQRLQLGSYLEHPPVEALAAGLDATILLGDGSTYDAANDVRFGPESMNPNPAEKDDEIPLDFLQPSTRADSLGRLAHYEIRVNAIAPGNIRTGIVRKSAAGEDLEKLEQFEEKIREQMRNDRPLKREGTVDDVAEAALYFATDRSRYVTGTVLPVDGGTVAGKVIRRKPK